MTEFYGHKNLLITQHNIGQSCTLLFSEEPFEYPECSGPACSSLLSGLVVTSGVTDGGQGDEPPPGKLNVKPGSPFS